MQKTVDRTVALLTWLFMAASWAVIVVAALAMGCATLPILYLVSTGQVQPGDLLPDGWALTTAEYVGELTTEIVTVAGGVTVKELAQWQRDFRRRRTLIPAARP